MQILDNVIILSLPVLAFIAGKIISDRYHERQIQELEYQLRLYAAERGVGYVAPPAKRKYVPIGQPFMDKLKENGHATQALRNPHT
jgi:hypothetical protein